MKDQYIQLKEGIYVQYNTLASIATIAAFETDGVQSIHGKLTDEILDRINIKLVKKTVEVVLEDEILDLNINIKIKYGFNIEQVSEKVQKAVHAAIMQATGISVSKVNINVLGIGFE